MSLLLLPEVDKPEGVTLFCPYAQGLIDKLVKVYISRFERKPNSLLLGCEQVQYTEANLEGFMKREGLIFSYKKALEKGFYRVEVTCNGRVGEELYPVLHGESSLIIGTPFSAYPPIELV